MSKAIVGFILLLCSGVNNHNFNYRRTGQLSQLQNNNGRKVIELVTSPRSGFVDSFVFVARSPENYSQLRTIIATVPTVSDDSFETQAYVGVFLGQRRTGGYDIELSIDEHGVLVLNERKPPPGAMLKMVLSAPFKLFAVPVRPNESLEFSLDETWKNRLLSYRLTKVETKQKAQLTGGIELLRSGSHLTYFFHLRRTDSPQPVVDVSSTEVDGNGHFILSRIPAIASTGSLLRGSGRLENELLTLQTDDKSFLLIFTRQPQ